MQIVKWQKSDHWLLEARGREQNGLQRGTKTLLRMMKMFCIFIGSFTDVHNCQNALNWTLNDVVYCM